MSLFPGLQRLSGDHNNNKEMIDQELAGNGNERRSESGVYRRLYLSEVWIIRRLGSPFKLKNSKKLKSY